MTLLVQKYGGSSIGTIDRIEQVAQKIINMKTLGHQVVVIVSAMYGETDRLIHLAHTITPHPDPREYDVLLSTGEQISIALLSIALNHKGCLARSFTGGQVGIHTDNTHTNAHILQIDTHIIQRELEQNKVVIIAGFQGINEYNEITTLGRGGSDTTAVAIAHALNANECQIYTDVDGVYTTDPHLIPEARLIPQICFEEMLEMASLGAKVLQKRAVEIASLHNIPIRVLSTFTENAGTLVIDRKDAMPQQKAVSGIAFNREEAMIALTNIPYQIGLESLIQDHIQHTNLEANIIAQHNTAQNTIDISLTMPRAEYNKTFNLIENLTKDLGVFSIKTNSKLAKLSLIGTGMRSELGVISKMLQILNQEQIDIHMITASDIKISVMIDEVMLEQSVRTLHKAFELDRVSTFAETQINI